jgi:ATP-dependent DNA helicase RecQ
MAELEEILKRYWGYHSFRPLQADIIQSVLDGNDTLALLPTGGGKSICFQVPALARPGICLVISPLIALMKDQVENLKKRGIHAQAIYSGMSRADIIRTLKNASYEHHKFLYVSPERMETSLFREYLPSLHINLIAVDEAHCISQWGYDFRPSYLRIAELRKELPRVPVLALTASATQAVQSDICNRLGFAKKNIFRQSFERPNLSYSAFRSEAKPAKLVDILKKVPHSGIVYCKSRKRTTELASLLKMHGIAAAHYHAGLSTDERTERQKDWISNKTRVMVCTNAFGMGIDKPDVRIVVHADIPDSLENYYQEAGRAGRDGKRSYAVLLYDEKDLDELRALHLQRYPTFEQIRSVYGSLVNFLQIPSGTGEYQSFTFRFDAFVRNFNLQGASALYCIKAMESDGWISFNEKSFQPSTVLFTTSKDLLYDFEKSHPEYEPLLTTLLRTYEGIFDFPGFISEQNLAWLLRRDEEEIKKALKEVHAFGIIRYAPQNEDPQIIFQKHRVAVEDFRINEAAYNKRRESFTSRVDTIIRYAQTNDCRSRTINKYFAADTGKDCGSCDNCIRKKETELSTEEFNAISHRINTSLTAGALQTDQLLDTLTGIKKEKAWQVIRFLQAENKLQVTDGGYLKWNN